MTGIKALKAGGIESGASLKEPEVEKVSLISELVDINSVVTLIGRPVCQCWLMGGRNPVGILWQHGQK